MKGTTMEIGYCRTMVTAVATAALALVALGGCSGASEPAPSTRTPPGTASEPAPEPDAVVCAPLGDDGVLKLTELTDACWATQLATILPAKAVVCFGEPSHGIAESGAARAMLLDTLASAAPVTIAGEFDDAMASEMSAYLQTGDEAPLKRGLMAAKGTLGATKATLDQFRKLRTIVVNTGHAITVRGIDVDIVNGPSIAQLAMLADRVAADIAADVRALPAGLQ